MQQTSKINPTPGATALDVGFASLTQILSEISLQTIEGNKFLLAIDKKFDNVLEISQSVVSLLNTELIENSTKIKNKTHELLSGIHQTISEILHELNNKKPVKNIPEKNKPSNDNEPSNRNISTGSDITSITELFNVLKASLNNKLFKLMDRFNTALDKMITLDDKKIKKFNENIEKFDSIIDKLEKHLKPVSLSLIGFALSFGILSLIVMSPMLPIALGILSGFLYLMQKTAGKKDMPKNMIEFAAGIGILTLAMIALSYVNWVSIMKMIVFAGALGLIFSLGGKRSNLPKDMIQFAAGLGILTLALFAMQEVDWGSVLKMILFAGTLGLIFSIGGSKNELPVNLMKFAFGLGILTLALYAMQYIQWESIGKLLLFIAGLGIELVLINKFGGGPMKGLPGFAFGLGLLVLAMYAMQELPISIMFTTLAFIAGLGLVLKLFNAQSGVSMLLISAGILGIAGAFWIYKQSGFEIKDALTLAGSLAIISAVIIGLGALSGIVLTGALALAAISASMLLSALSLAAVSALNIDFGKLLEFMGAVGLITLGFALLAIPAIPGAIGAVLFIPIAVSALLGAGTLALISILPINTDTVSNFMSAVRAITFGFAAIAIPAIPGAIGAALFLPIGVASLLAAGSLALISAITIDPKKIDSFALGIQGLVNAYNDVGLIKLAKVALKSAALLPIIAVSTMAALLFKTIETIDYIKASVGLTIMIQTLTTTFDKLSTWKTNVTDSALKSIAMLGASLKVLNDIGFEKLSNTMNMFINGLADDVKWAKINANLETMRDTVKDIVTNMNMINLSKSLALERNLKLLTQQLTNQNLKIVIDELKQLIGLLNESQLITTQQYQNSNNQNNNQNSNTPAFTSFNPILPESNSKEKSTLVNMEDLENILNQILAKLGGNLNVVLVEGSINRFK